MSGVVVLTWLLDGAMCGSAWDSFDSCHLVDDWCPSWANLVRLILRWRWRGCVTGCWRTERRLVPGMAFGKDRSGAFLEGWQWRRGCSGGHMMYIPSGLRFWVSYERYLYGLRGYNTHFGIDVYVLHQPTPCRAEPSHIQTAKIATLAQHGRHNK
ncbi:hypothetical protein B0T14DRAFT_249062 [Immersiella caudata]|uniref:Secreted protein n=1 Tax=Immersiella caudata TaxID=314043 RepID=A0AA39WJP7_9PEZI|nr:hypothetical protein B0T14DRAFT_249062 [Immersiella caudata]